MPIAPKLPIGSLSVFTIALVACGGGSSSGSDVVATDTMDDSSGDTDGSSEGDEEGTSGGRDDTGGDGGEEQAAGFPSGVAVASPTATSDAPGQALPPGTLAATTWTSDYAFITEQIQGVLEGSVELAAVFKASSFVNRGHDAACYGPHLDYRDHPDARDGEPTDGSLPTGDLGLWLEVDPMTGDACAAAELNARVSGARDQTSAAFLLAAGMVAAANEAGLALPAPGGAAVSVTDEMNAAGLNGVSFTSASIEQPQDGTWIYAIEFDFTEGPKTLPVTVTLTHQETSSTSYEGGLTWSVLGDDTVFHGGNCNQMQRTLAGSLAYNRESETEVALQMRYATFCGAGGDTFDDGNQVDPSNRFSPDSPNGWSENFSIFAARFDPTTVAGDYAYVWQAGAMDSHSRVFNIGINSGETVDGEAYFGFGAPIFESVGSVEGFICNWAGPGQSHALQSAAQRQFVQFDLDSGLFVQPDGGSDMRYAPTNSCSYDGSGTFWYDRDLDGNPGDDVVVETADFLRPSAGQSVPDAISARGFSVPEVPGGWPGEN